MQYFLRSLRFAFSGLYQFFRHERNGQIQGVLALVVVAAGFFFGVSRMEWLVLLLCIALVISLEMLNTAIERICNMYTTDYHPAIKIIKDVAAAAVLWAAMLAAVAGAVIFWPYVLQLL
jgi:undecaprenol kinase/diacylglycerol kinase (ATP)